MGGNQYDADWTTPEHKKNINKVYVWRIKEHKFSIINVTSGVLTFPGILAASTERQFTQEAITSTGGLMTDVSLINGKQ